MSKKLSVAILSILLSLVLYSPVKAVGIIEDITINANTDLTIDDERDRVYVLTQEADIVSVFDAISNSMLSDIMLSNGDETTGLGIGVNKKTGEVYAHKRATGGFTNPSPPAFIVLDGPAGTDTGNRVPIEGGTNDIASGDGFIFATGLLFKDGLVHSIKGNSIVDTIMVGSFPSKIAVDSENGVLYIADTTLEVVQVIGVSMSGSLSSKGTISVGEDLDGSIAVNGKTERVYVGAGNGNVHVVNAKNSMIIATIDVPTNTSFVSGERNFISDIAVDPTRDKFYVALSDRTNDVVVAFDGKSNTVDEQTDLGDFVFSALKIHPKRNKIYALSSSRDRLVIIGGSEKASTGGGNSSGGDDNNDNNENTGDEIDVETEIEINKIKEDAKENSEAFNNLISTLIELSGDIGDGKKPKKVQRGLNKIDKSIDSVNETIEKLDELSSTEVEKFLGIKIRSKEVKSCVKTLRSLRKALRRLKKDLNKASCENEIPGKCILNSKVDKALESTDKAVGITERGLDDNNGNGFPDVCDVFELFKRLKGDL